MSKTLLALFAGLALVAGANPANASPSVGQVATVVDPVPAGLPNFTGKWMIARPIRRLHTSEGADPPLNAAGKALYAKTQAALRADPKSDPVSKCVMQGIPRLLLAPYPFLILQYGKHVDFVHETNHTFRIVYFDQPPPDDPDPHWLGWPVASWYGKTLVIDSIGFNDQTWLDYSGLPHGTKLKVQERYRLDGQKIKVRAVITDPEFYTAPWSTDFSLARQPGGYALNESICVRDHRM